MTSHGPRLLITRRLVALLLSAGAAGYVGLAGQRAPDEKPWIGYAGSVDGSRFFNSKQIDKNNVRSLEVAWVYPHGESVFHPMMAHGTVYGRRRNGALVALDARTGKELWIHDGLQGMTTRGMDYWESPDGRDRRLIFSMNDYLQEIDASTGKSIMTFGTDGVVDLREGLGRDPTTMGRVQSGTPGQVFENLILLGSATGEGYMSPPGDLRAYDVITGKLVWQFHTVPHPGEFGYETWPKDAWKYVGGTNAWGELTIDVKRGIAYIPTGSPTYDFYGGDRHGANLFSDCLLALDARTGKRLWHFQTTHHDLWDFDNNAAPQLTTIRHNGRNVDVVALAGKTGFLYVFDRVTGAPIWPIEERPVPKGDMPGEQYWPTQPYPTNPPPFARQSFSMDDVSSLSNVAPAAREQLLERLKTAKNVGLHTPISTEWTVHMPGNNGGALFGTTSAEPTTGRVYVVGQNNPAVLRLYKPGEGPQRGGGPGATPGQAAYQRYCQQCHGADRAGTPTGSTLLTVPGRLDTDTVRELITNGRGQMPPFAHLSAEELTQLITYVLSPPGRGRGAGPGAGGRGAGPAEFAPPPELVVGTGGAKERPGGPFGRRGGPPTYPEGVPQYVQYSINGAYGTIGNLMKPPYTTITAYDLNRPVIRWQIGFGDDPSLAADGLTDTGIPQMRNSVIVTASGLLFGIGGDGHIRAYDTDTGRVLWMAKLGAGVGTRGSPILYELDGRAYLLVPVGIPGAGRGGAAAAPGTPTPGETLPSGYVAFTLPKR